jgi:hypothetical protein
MDIHKAKPWHNFREFLKEYIIIVVGVLTALGAEQAVDQLRWSQRTREVHEQLLAETSGDAGSALLWLTISSCLDQQLMAADQQVWQARRTGLIQPSGHRFSPTLVGFSSDSWLNARSMQVADHLPAKEIEQFTDFYFLATEMTDNITRLHSLAGELEPLARPLDHVAPAEADEFIGKIGRIKELQSRMEIATTLMIRYAGRVRAPIPLAQVRAELPSTQKVYGSCVSDPAEMLRRARRANLDDQNALRGMGLATPDLPQ